MQVSGLCVMVRPAPGHLDHVNRLGLVLQPIHKFANLRADHLKVPLAIVEEIPELLLIPLTIFNLQIFGVDKG